MNLFLEAFKHCHGGGEHDDAEAQLLAATHTFQQSYTNKTTVNCRTHTIGPILLIK